MLNHGSLIMSGKHSRRLLQAYTRIAICHTGRWVYIIKYKVRWQVTLCNNIVCNFCSRVQINIMISVCSWFCVLHLKFHLSVWIFSMRIIIFIFSHIFIFPIDENRFPSHTDNVWMHVLVEYYGKTFQKFVFMLSSTILLL